MRPWMAWMGVALLVVSARPGRGDVQYSVTDLGALAGVTSSWALGISETGVVVGTGILNSGAYQAYAWSGGTGWPVNFGPSDWSSGAMHANASGQIVGGHSLDVQTPLGNGALLNPDGTVTDLGYGSCPWSINDSGQVVGCYVDPITGAQTGFSWTQGVMTYLAGPRGLDTTAADINNSGQIAGSEFGIGSRSYACLWYKGGVRDLGALTPDADSDACAINEAGSVVGSSALPAIDEQHATLWSDGKVLDMGTLGGKGSVAFDINNLGEAVGYSTLAGSGQSAFLWRSGTMIDLNTLVPSNSGWTLVWADGINDSGQIVGWGYTDGAEHAFLLSPVPEPLSLWIACVGAVGLLGRRSH